MPVTHPAIDAISDKFCSANLGHLTRSTAPADLSNPSSGEHNEPVHRHRNAARFLSARAATNCEPPQSITRGGLAAWKRRMIADYIDGHLGDHLSLASLSQLAHLSRFHFCRAFKSAFGTSFRRYHTCRRIERAEALLMSSGLSVDHIGRSVGFNDGSAFCKAFRKQTGHSPTDYRRLSVPLECKRAARTISHAGYGARSNSGTQHICPDGG